MDDSQRTQSEFLKRIHGTPEYTEREKPLNSIFPLLFSWFLVSVVNSFKEPRNTRNTLKEI